jgi:cobalamin biosynthesis protein CobD/CbiB
MQSDTLRLTRDRRRLRWQAHEVVWIGDGNPRAHVEDIRRALHLFGIACLLNGLVVIGFVMFTLP